MPTSLPGGDLYLTPEELINRYKNKITLKTLANWRAGSDGPAYLKIGGRVLYAIDDVLRWEGTRKVAKLFIWAGAWGAQAYMMELDAADIVTLFWEYVGINFA